MTYTYDLLDAPWIPCIDVEGHAVHLGLRDALVNAHVLREIDGESPLVTAAIYRLLLAVLHRVHGPEGWDDWYALWHTGRLDPVPLDSYLGHWHERFDLFHPDRPFYQVPDMDPCFKPKSVASLVFDAASGNNATLFDHHTDAEGLTLTPAQAARALVAAQALGLAGLCRPGFTCTSAPRARGIIFLVHGDTLFETLLLNLIRYDDAEPMPSGSEDRPAWEMGDPFSPDRDIPLGYLDYLTWQNRRVHLLPQATENGPIVRMMTLGPGLRLSQDVADPQKHYRRDEKRGPLPLRFDDDRSLWRESAALFSLTTTEHQPPRAFGWLAELVGEGYLNKKQTRRVLALGMAINKKRAAKIEFSRSERWPLPLAYLENADLVEALEETLAMAERASNQLWGGARTMATFFICPEADFVEAHQPAPEDLDKVMGQWDMQRRYWAQLEVPFRVILEALPDGREEALALWQTTLRHAAWDAFEGIASNLDGQPRSLKAAVRGRGQLGVGLAKALPAE